MRYPPTREEYNELRNKLKLFEQNNKQNKNDDTTHKTMMGKKKGKYIYERRCGVKIYSKR